MKSFISYWSRSLLFWSGRTRGSHCQMLHYLMFASAYRGVTIRTCNVDLKWYKKIVCTRFVYFQVGYDYSYLPEIQHCLRFRRSWWRCRFLLWLWRVSMSQVCTYTNWSIAAARLTCQLSLTLGLATFLATYSWLEIFALLFQAQFIGLCM